MLRKMPLNDRHDTNSAKLTKPIPALLAALVAVLTLSLSPGIAVADEWEWDPTYGYHEEEWYDPSDWFDANTGVDYESDYFGDYYEPGDGDYGYDSWYGDGYYTNDWYDEEPDFDNWYDGAYD